MLGYNFTSKDSIQQIANDHKVARTTSSDYCYNKCYTNVIRHINHLQVLLAVMMHMFNKDCPEILLQFGLCLTWTRLLI